MKPEYFPSSFILNNEIVSQQLIMYGVFSLYGQGPVRLPLNRNLFSGQGNFEVLGFFQDTLANFLFRFGGVGTDHRFIFNGILKPIICKQGWNELDAYINPSRHDAKSNQNF